MKAVVTGGSGFIGGFIVKAENEFAIFLLILLGVFGGLLGVSWGSLGGLFGVLGPLGSDRHHLGEFGWISVRDRGLACRQRTPGNVLLASPRLTTEPYAVVPLSHCPIVKRTGRA
mgnify:CR=1 FL=1